MSNYLDMEDFLSVLNVTKVEDFDVAKLLGVNLRYNYDVAFRNASTYGHLSVVIYLLEQGADIHAIKDEALRWASENGHLPVV